MCAQGQICREVYLSTVGVVGVFGVFGVVVVGVVVMCLVWPAEKPAVCTFEMRRRVYIQNVEHMDVLPVHTRTF